MSFVSIIVPNYNHAVFLPKRLDSILAQTFQDFELILLDDFSTDNSRNILYEYSKHPKVSHYIKNEKNSGNTFNQWQIGIELAKGELIWIAESDDYCEDVFLERLVSYLDRNAHVALAYSQSLEFSDENEIQYPAFSADGGLYERRFLRSAEINNRTEIRENLIYLNTIPNASAVLFRKANNSLFFDRKLLNMRLCGDWLFWIKCLESGDMYYCADALNHFRTHGNNVRNKSYLSAAHVYERIQVIRYAKKRFSVPVGKTIKAYVFQLSHSLHLSTDILFRMSALGKLLKHALKNLDGLLFLSIIYAYGSFGLKRIS